MPVTQPVVPDPTDISKSGGNLDNPGFGGPRAGAAACIVGVTDKSITTNVATLVLGTHPFAIGDSVVVRLGDAIFDGTFTVTAADATSISYTKTHADVAVSSAQTITNKKIANHIATLTFASHNFNVGDVVTVSGLTGFNGNFVVQAKTSSTISYAIGAADVTSAAGSGTVTRISALGTVESALRNPAFITPEAPQQIAPTAVSILPDTGHVVSGARW